MTVAIEMGHTNAGASATLDLEELLATRLLVQGNSGSGKSHLLRRLLEQSAPWVQQTIIDPEGDFVALADRFGHLLINAEDHTERGLQVAGERARIHRVSTVLNLEGLDAENQMRRAAAFLGGLFEVGRDHWYLCHEHRSKWSPGSNLFSGWRHEDEGDWLVNRAMLAGYSEVEPYMPPWSPRDVPEGGKPGDPPF